MVVAGGEESSGGRTVVVGVKLDSYSRELLTWALVKVAHAGDRVIALHVLKNNEIVDRDGKSSLLSLVKAFDSILEVYEGFCNLKQVDLKLKICRGSSVQKILVREAKSYYASEVIVGTAQTHHTIRSSASVAKYCAKKLCKECSVLAVNNGKIVFHRESTLVSRISVKELEHNRRNGLLNALQRSFSKNIKVLNDGSPIKPMLTWEEGGCGKSDLALVSNEAEQKCSICSPAWQKACRESSVEKPPNDEGKRNSMAIVPVQKMEVVQKSVSLLLKNLSEVKPGWPLLRRAMMSNRNYSQQVRQISVVEWVMRLPSRYYLYIENSSRKNYDYQDQSSKLDGETGAIVAVGNEAVDSVPTSPDSVSGSLPEELEGLHEKYSASCRLFQFRELELATSNFKPGNMIGKGGSSQVYRGCLPDGKELAVKILKASENALKEFVLEIEIINAIHHKNIISLFGFCFEDDNLLLVYDFLSRGSLEENLHGNKNDFLFGWNERYRVAIGVAEALDYLHSREGQPVIHRDVKSSNILLSEDFEPQLSDFGLAKWASADSTHITCTDVAGTFGYLAPEYFMYGKVNEKIDVYAYGVVLLELLSGRKPISNNCLKGQESLVMWAKPILTSDKFTALLDPNLGSNYDHDQVERMLLAASLCIRRAPRARPQMSHVLKLLRGDPEVVKWARLQVNASDGSIHVEVNNSVEGNEAIDDEFLSKSNLQSHLNLAMLGVEEDSMSVSSIEQSVSLEDYLRGRWSRSSSFD